MTGFGRAQIDVKRGSFIIELQSINRKFLESSIFSPKEYSSLEIDLRKIISKRIFRGQITLRINFFPSEENIDQLLPSIKYLENLKKGWEKIAQKLKLDRGDIDLNFLVGQLKYTKEENPDFENEKQAIFKCLEKAVDEIISMKNREGLNLFKDIKKRLKLMESDLLKIQKIGVVAFKKYESKLKEKLLEFLNQQLAEERIIRETAIYAEKVDITEEITRLNSHLKQFYFLMEKEETVGRKLDFLLQEMMREANTIASKSCDKDISTKIVDIKSELEKIREQVQNIE